MSERDDHDDDDGRDDEIRALLRALVQAIDTGKRGHLPEPLRPLARVLTVKLNMRGGLPALDDADVAAVAAIGRFVHGILLAFLDEPAFAEPDAPGGGFIPVRAAELLARLGVTDAIEPMLDIVDEDEWDTYLHNVIVNALPRYGAAIVEPILKRLEGRGEEDGDGATSLLDALSSAGVRDDRIYAKLAAHFARDQLLGASFFASYGDPRALELILPALDAFDVDVEADAADDDDEVGPRAIVDLVDAVVELGGTVTPENRAKLDAYLATLPSRTVRRAAPKVGRNDPCPCGSGKKYKKCHGAPGASAA